MDIKRFVFTAGIFDVLDGKGYNILHTINKKSYPDGDTCVLVFDDYSVFKLTGSFPQHELEVRVKNVKHFCETVFPITLEEYERTLGEIIRNSREEGLKPFFVTYNDNKNFIGRELLKRVGVPITFVK